MNFLIKYHTFTFGFYCFGVGYLVNAVVRRVSQPVWPSDTKYPLILLALTVFCALMQWLVISINLKKITDERPPHN